MGNKVYKKYNTNNLLHPFKRNRVNKILVSTNNSYLKHYSSAGENSYVYANVSSPDYLMLNDEFMSYAYIYVNGDTQTYYKIFENYSYTYTESFNDHCPKIMKDNNTYILLAYDFVTGSNNNNIIINYNVNPNPHNNQTNVNEFSISYSFKNINDEESLFDGTYVLGNSIGISPEVIKNCLGNSSYATIINEFTYSYVNNNHEIVDDGISVSSFDDCIYVWDFKDGSAEVSYAEEKLSAYINIAYSDELYDTTKNININTLYSPELIIDNFNPIENQTFEIDEYNSNDNKIKQEIDTTSIIRSDYESLNDILNKPSLRDNSSLYTLSGKIRGKSNCLTNAINEYNYNDEGFNTTINNLPYAILHGDLYFEKVKNRNNEYGNTNTLLTSGSSKAPSQGQGGTTLKGYIKLYSGGTLTENTQNNRYELSYDNNSEITIEMSCTVELNEENGNYYIDEVSTQTSCSYYSNNQQVSNYIIGTNLIPLKDDEDPMEKYNYKITVKNDFVDKIYNVVHVYPEIKTIDNTTTKVYLNMCHNGQDSTNSHWYSSLIRDNAEMPIYLATDTSIPVTTNNNFYNEENSIKYIDGVVIIQQL